MNIQFEDNPYYDNLSDIFISKDDKTLTLLYGSNGDLYIDIKDELDNLKDDKGISVCEILIENDDLIYKYFDKFLNDILECNVFKLDKFELEMCNSKEEVIEKIKYNEGLNKNLKESKEYNKLVNNGEISWYSDSIYDERANLLRIIKKEKGILLIFQENMADPSFGIKISNFGSKYGPFSVCFKRLKSNIEILKKENINVKRKNLIK